MSTEVTLAQAPFDVARADLILQSSGHEPIHFRVSKLIMAVASSETLDLSLRHIYPVRSPTVTRLSQIRMLAEFAHKYQVNALEQDVSRYLMDAVDGDPTFTSPVSACATRTHGAVWRTPRVSCCM